MTASEPRSTILVLGAAGRLGRTVAEAFVAAGWRVKGLVRAKNGAPSRLPAGVEAVVADATNREAVIAAAHGVDVIFHGLNPLYTEWENTVLPMGDVVIAAARASGATILFPGNVYNFGANMPATLTSTTPEAPTTSKGRLRQQLEQRLRDAAVDGVRTIVVRAGDFFGGTGPGTWVDLAVLKDDGVITWPAADLDVVHAWAYLPDLAATFVQVAAARAALQPFEVFCFEGHNVSGAEFIAALDTAIQQAGQPPRRRKTMPWWAMGLISPFVPMVKAIREMRYLWTTPHALVDDRLARLPGAVPRTPLVEAACHLLPTPAAQRSAA
jgi:nucleoside-diphosphate-sugar epimerase